MTSYLKIKRIVSLCLFCSILLSITTVSVYADKKSDTICYIADDGYVYCDYGMDMSKKNLTGAADAKSDNKWAGSREIYLGGTWDGETYNYDGELIDKFTFELTKNSNDNTPLSCEANLYINDGNTKYCTYQIVEFCDFLLYIVEEGQTPELNEQKLQLFETFGTEFRENSNSILDPLMTGTALEECNCGEEYEFISDSQILEQLITQLVEMYSEGLLDGFDEDKFNEMINVLLEEYETAIAAESQSEASGQAQGQSSGAEVLEIKQHNARCRVIGIDVDTNEPVTSCFWGHRIENTKIIDGDEITNERVLAKEEIYLGGTYGPEVDIYGYLKYNYDGYFVGRYKKNFKYNDNADVFWKVEVGLNRSTLEYCTMRDQEYSDTSRTKEICQSLYIDIQ